MTPEEFTMVAEDDLFDIRAADHFVLYSHLTPPLPTRQGHSTELGYALGINDARAASTNKIRICIVGVRTLNVFHHSKDVRLFESWQTFFTEHAVSGVLLNGGTHATSTST